MRGGERKKEPPSFPEVFPHVSLNLPPLSFPPLTRAPSRLVPSYPVRLVPSHLLSACPIPHSSLSSRPVSEGKSDQGEGKSPYLSLKSDQKKVTKVESDDDYIYDDLDRALAELAQADADAVALTEEVCDRPSPRIQGSLTALTDPEHGYKIRFAHQWKASV